VIRESLQTLEQHGLVTSADKLGFVVRKFGTQELVDAYRVREVLEGLASRLCCRKASRDDIDLLRDLAQQIHSSSGKKSRAARSDLEYKFHHHFLTLSGNETLQRVSVGYRFVGNLVVTDRDPDQLLQEHLAIVEAVADNQPDEAERLARLHVARSADSIMIVQE
jgi:DNA-binding GntR family transcriptional regulator